MTAAGYHFKKKSSAVTETGDRLATTDMCRKVGSDVPLSGREAAGSPSNTMWPMG